MAATIFQLAPLIPVLPFVAFLVALTAGRWLPEKGAYVGILAAAGSLGLSVWTLLAVNASASSLYVANELYTWAAVEGLSLTFGVLLDPLSTFMLVLVALIATLVFVFSLGYMNHDEHHRERGGLPRYYASVALFTASMLAFVLASNLLMAFIFFELVGLCSYLLIGFWLTDRAPASAAKKAFLVTRFGDYFFLVGVVGVLATFGTAAFAEGGFPQLASDALATSSPVGPDGPLQWLPGGIDPQAWFTILGLLVLGGAIGKSAQFPLHTWLPDAMEGPTPISALIHAATMVAAGVYLLARMFGFYAELPQALAVIAFIGGFTALFAATMGVVKDDIKQVLAYSTISQYGYMMLGLGVGGYVAATFHLMTHAYFKALLFLGAGAIIVATHHQDMWALGGLREHLPVTRWTFLAGALSLAGIAPFSGFWSKEEVLFDALIVGLEHPLLLGAYAMALVAVLLTGFYTFRMYFLTFHGEPRSDAASDPDPVGWAIKLPLVVLGTLAVVAGFVNMKPVDYYVGADLLYLERWLDGVAGALSVTHYHELLSYSEAAISPLGPTLLTLGLALIGAYMAHLLYNVPDPDRYFDGTGVVDSLLKHNYYQDELQVWLATGLTGSIARVSNLFDQRAIDGLVDGTASAGLIGGDRVRNVQFGVLPGYVALLVGSVVVLILVAGLYGGWWM